MNMHMSSPVLAACEVASEVRWTYRSPYARRCSSLSAPPEAAFAAFAICLAACEVASHARCWASGAGLHSPSEHCAWLLVSVTTVGDSLAASMCAKRLCCSSAVADADDALTALTSAHQAFACMQAD